MNPFQAVQQTAMKLGVQKASLNMLQEYSPSLANLASDWLRAKRALLWVRREKEGGDGVDISLAWEEIDSFIDLWEVQPCL